MEVEDTDPVPEIIPKHFEDAVRNGRRSVSDRDLAQYSAFASSLSQARSQITAAGGSIGAFSFPNRQRNAPAAAAEEDDLYGGPAPAPTGSRTAAPPAEEEDDLYS
jgi:transitional endoplasmic reticulum ATPase